MLIKVTQCEQKGFYFLLRGKGSATNPLPPAWCPLHCGDVRSVQWLDISIEDKVVQLDLKPSFFLDHSNSCK